MIHDSASTPEKVDSRCLKLYRAYSISLDLSNVGNCFVVELQKAVPKFGKRKRKMWFCVHVLYKT